MLMRSGAPVYSEPPLYPTRSPLSGTGIVARPPVTGPVMVVPRNNLIVSPIVEHATDPTPANAGAINNPGLATTASGTSGGCTSCQQNATTAANFIAANPWLFVVGLVVILGVVFSDDFKKLL